MDFRKLLKTRKYIVLDGAMGTMVQARGLKLGGIPEELNVTNPDMIKEIHSLYIENGSDVVYTNTFGANGYKLSHSEYSVEQLVSEGVRLAKEVCMKYEKDGHRPLVALDLGPIGQLLEPTGNLSFEQAYDYFAQMLKAGKEADVVCFETMSDLLELKAGILAAKENTDLPVMCTMTFEKNLRTFTGTSIESMAITCESLGVDAIGVNCSLGPKELYPVIEKMSRYTTLPLIVKANAGLPDPVTNKYSITPDEFTEQMLEMAKFGVQIFGGCCGTDEKFIGTLKVSLDQYDFKTYLEEHMSKTTDLAVCSNLKAVSLIEPRIIGERINPTGKKKFKEALLNNDIDYILNQAIEQVEAGAEILDVNVGLPGIDEKAMMVKVIKELQAVVDVPLQIDSTMPEVLEAALRVYNGKPIVNSVNGEEKSMEAILPLIKKYGACVVCLTLDEGGIPKKAKDRVSIAKKIKDRAVSMGIPERNLIIDCLTLTASAEQEGVVETLNAVETVTKEMGLKTVLGVSNISFGLPNRELINHVFLTMALERGLTLPIMNPNVVSMTGAFRAFKLLKAYDKDSTDFINNYGSVSIKTLQVNNGETIKVDGGNTGDASKNTTDNQPAVLGNDAAHQLRYAMENGLRAEGIKYTKELLNAGVDSMEIVNDILIPALDKVGELFEKGKLYLPQLILSAGVAGDSFEVIKENMSKGDYNPVSKGKIILATVKGDIHDIGKNIVKVLLENYGYTVIDLGKDVDYQTVVDAAIEYNVKLVGLSALMTTTLVSMEETIKLLRANNVDCKVVVGGAVLTPEYAKQIGADYYSKDAKETVDIAKMVFGN